MSPTNYETMRQDLLAHARSLTELTTICMGLKETIEKLAVAKAVMDATAVKDDQALERRLKQIEDDMKEMKEDFDKKFDKLNRLGWWLLVTFFGSIILAFANFMLKGGLTITTITSPN